MSKIVVCSMLSLDGFTEGRGGDVMSLPLDEAFNEFIAEGAFRVEHFLFGATSYRGMLEFWPHQVDNPQASSWDRYIASRFAGEATITVVSDSLTREEIPVWGERTELIRRAEAHQKVARMRARGDGDVLIYGSRTLWTDLLAHGLVDELFVMIGAKLVAGDHRAFTAVPETPLRLLGVRSWTDSDNVVLHYAT